LVVIILPPAPLVYLLAAPPRSLGAYYTRFFSKYKQFFGFIPNYFCLFCKHITFKALKKIKFQTKVKKKWPKKGFFLTADSVSKNNELRTTNYEISTDLRAQKGKVAGF
jgi:hypothetical protein